MRDQGKAQARNPVDSAMEAWRDDLLPLVLLAALGSGLLVVLGGSILNPHYHLAPALMWSLGFCASGMLLGFLFGIPRTLPAGAVKLAAETMATGDGSGAGKPGSRRDTGTPSPPAPNEINSNLVEVSDWLTKIIVGVGLVELKNLPRAAYSVAEFIAPGLAIANDVALPIAGGIMMYFSVLGFLIGYLLTRIYLAIIIKRADNLVIIQNDQVRLAAGTEIEVHFLSKLQQTAIDDLQEIVGKLVLATPKNLAVATTVPPAPSPFNKSRQRRILWVDDVPTNNTLLVEQFKLIETEVEQVTTTDAALARISQEKFDLVITDMARLEDGRRVQDAGLILIREAMKLRPELQIVVYCSRGMAAMHGKAAEQAGARLVTSSGTALLAVVRPILDAATLAEPPR
ncbi:response regulator [Massilia genomosp. 1]|uniref:Response regulator n=1 Tax=Massilia genomosp. 1 TaxID=2609280 RepID=A0ABX0MMR2_9BURK|nr:response regulator [Massilia genomosp. 1]NHZ64065.1 response regulator [Massilia genomosp. 1]